MSALMVQTICIDLFWPEAPLPGFPLFVVGRLGIYLDCFAVARLFAWGARSLTCWENQITCAGRGEGRCTAKDANA